jgi:beta-glucanase (GH16 family)
MQRAFVFILSFWWLAAGAAGAATTLNGAELYSNESVKYGRWEVRMRVAATPGSVSSFFTYYANSSMGSEPWREIDIEILGKNGKGFQSNLITGTAAARATSEAFHASAADLSQGFHTYVLEWTPDSIVYRLDGQTVRNTPASNQQVKDLSDKPETYRMNLWATTAADWAGQLDPSKLPIAQTVNWIAYSAYTPGQGPGGSNFTPKWTDDFNTLDAQRWSRGSWTFDGNMADMTPANAVVSGGYLMLILSQKGWTGTLTPPADPQGNTRPPVALASSSAPERFRMEVRAGALHVDLGDGPAEAVVAGLDGRVLARRTGTGDVAFAGLPRGILFVRTPVGTRRVALP